MKKSITKNLFLPHLTVSQFARGQSRALGQHRPSGVGGMSPPGHSSVRHPIAEQSLETMDPFIIRAVSTCIKMVSNGQGCSDTEKLCNESITNAILDN